MAFVDPDYTRRLDPTEIIRNLRTIGANGLSLFPRRLLCTLCVSAVAFQVFGNSLHPEDWAKWHGNNRDGGLNRNRYRLSLRQTDTGLGSRGLLWLQRSFSLKRPRLNHGSDHQTEAGRTRALFQREEGQTDLVTHLRLPLQNRQLYSRSTYLGPDPRRRRIQPRYDGSPVRLQGFGRASALVSRPAHGLRDRYS